MRKAIRQTVGNPTRVTILRSDNRRRKPKIQIIILLLITHIIHFFILFFLITSKFYSKKHDLCDDLLDLFYILTPFVLALHRACRANLRSRSRNLIVGQNIVLLNYVPHRDVKLVRHARWRVTSNSASEVLNNRDWYFTKNFYDMAISLFWKLVDTDKGKRTNFYQRWTSIIRNNL